MELTLDNTKKIRGQFYTTNYNYILQNITIPEDIHIIIEPFAGKGDLLNFIDIANYEIECYDIEPKQDYIIERDTLNNPPDYNNKFIITNPPYLARNKSKDKSLFNKYKTNDLYKCFIEELIINNAQGGIIILPLNFWCSIRKNDIDLRKRFLNIYSIINLNIFEEKVFDDTTYTICSFHFELLNSNNSNNSNNGITTWIYPSKQNISIILNDTNNYIIGGEIYDLLQNNDIKIERLTRTNKKKKEKYITNIFLKCIDNNQNNKISLSIVDDNDIFVDNTPNLSARSFASIIIKPEITLEQQILLVDKFNNFLNEKREIYNSLFLTNYRESNSIARKRISFSLSFQIINYLLNCELNQS
jgi:hypothetical protein